MEEMRNAHNILIRKPEGKRPHGKRKRRWENIIRKETGRQGGKVWNGFVWLRIGTSGGLL
jgi:hypothetical protein